MSLRSHIVFFGTIVILVYAASLMWVFPGSFIRLRLTTRTDTCLSGFALTARAGGRVVSAAGLSWFCSSERRDTWASSTRCDADRGGVARGLACGRSPFRDLPVNGHSPIAVLAYLVLLFHITQFYFHHRHDGTAGLATLFVFLALMAAVSWLRAPAWSSYAWTLVLTALMALSKETYALSLPFLVAALCLLDWRNSGWKRALALTGGVCAVEAIAPGYDVLRFLHFTGPLASGIRLCSRFAPFIGPNCLFALTARMPSLRFQPHALALRFAAIGDCLAQAIGYDYAFGFYRGRAAGPDPERDFAEALRRAIRVECSASGFRRGAVCSAGQKWSDLATAGVLVLALVSIWANKPVYRSPAMQWLLGQDTRQCADHPGTARDPHSYGRFTSNSGVGLGASYHPWDMPDFLRQYFGRDVDWAFVIPRSQNESARPNILMLKPSSIHLNRIRWCRALYEERRVARCARGATYKIAATDTPKLS